MKLCVFYRRPYGSRLYNHPLTGEWTGYRLIAVGGDWQVDYKMVDANRYSKQLVLTASCINNSTPVILRPNYPLSL